MKNLKSLTSSLILLILSSVSTYLYLTSRKVENQMYSAEVSVNSESNTILNTKSVVKFVNETFMQGASFSYTSLQNSGCSSYINYFENTNSELEKNVSYSWGNRVLSGILIENNLPPFALSKVVDIIPINVTSKQKEGLYCLNLTTKDLNETGTGNYLKVKYGYYAITKMTFFKVCNNNTCTKFTSLTPTIHIVSSSAGQEVKEIDRINKINLYCQ